MEPTYPAFPLAPTDFRHGLTKRELLAAMAMQGFIANSHLVSAPSENVPSYKDIAVAALRLADALIEQVSKSE